ncbi:hypothetical protein ES708_22328 [subsurface metagenome]
MAANKHTGAANRKDKPVTYNELKINGQKPKFPLVGDQSEEPMSCDNDCSSNNGLAFKYNAIPIIKGKNRMIVKAVTIHVPDKRSIMTRFNIICHFNLFR